MRKPKLNQHHLWSANLSIVVQLGLTMAGCIGFGFFVGRYLDAWLESRGVMTVLLILFGVIGGGVVCYRQILEALPRQDASDTRPPRGKD